MREASGVWIALTLLVLNTACGAPGAAKASPQPVAPRSPVALPPASAHPNYPPKDLADIVALGGHGIERRFLGAEGQNLGPCSRGWERIYEPEGVDAKQKAADVVMFALSKRLFTQSCGGMVFGTTTNNFAACNCYHGEQGFLEIDRGSSVEPAPGKMRVFFEAVQDRNSPGDWDITVDAPTG